MKRGWLIKLLCPQVNTAKEAYNFLISLWRKWRGHKKMRTPTKVAAGGIIGFFSVLLLFWVAFPKILKSQIKGQVSLKPKNEIRGLYVQTPFPLTFKIHVFNVTNYKEVGQGAVPVVDEVGPFVFDEWKEKVDQIDNETDDTLIYRMKDTFIYNRELSGSLTMDEVVAVPHPLLVGMGMLVARTQPGMLNIASKALKAIFTENVDHPFVITTVRDLFFEGLVINCTSTDFAAKAVCTQLPTQIKGLVTVQEKIYKFSLFGPRNGTAGNKFKVSRGIKKVHDLGKVLEFEDQKELDVWPTKECNQYAGTDSTIFPPFLAIEEGLVSFAPDMCRSLKATYESDDVYDGIPCRKYGLSLGDMSVDPELKCFCPKPDQCYKRGVMDITNCSKAPLIVSLPHFYDSDEMYVKGVRGLHPNEHDHAIKILFEPMTGSPLYAKKRLQFSFPLAPVEKIKCMSNLPDTIVPFFWVEEGVELNRTWTAPLVTVFKALKVVKIAKWILLVVTLIVACAGGFLQFKGQNSVSITPVRTVQQAVENQKNQLKSMMGSPVRNGHENGQKY